MKDAVVRECRRCGAWNNVPWKELAAAGRCDGCKAALPPAAEPLDVDVATFDAIVSSVQVPVLVDFWARWCPPCRLASPGVKKTAAKMSGRAIVLKVDTDLVSQSDYLGPGVQGLSPASKVSHSRIFSLSGRP